MCAVRVTREQILTFEGEARCILDPLPLAQPGRYDPVKDKQINRGGCYGDSGR